MVALPRLCMSSIGVTEPTTSEIAPLKKQLHYCQRVRMLISPKLVRFRRSDASLDAKYLDQYKCVGILWFPPDPACLTRKGKTTIALRPAAAPARQQLPEYAADRRPVK